VNKELNKFVVVRKLKNKSIAIEKILKEYFNIKE
jgi:hypothetical protein